MIDRINILSPGRKEYDKKWEWNYGMRLKKYRNQMNIPS